MKLFKKLILGSIVAAISITGLSAMKPLSFKPIPSKSKGPSQSFTINMSTARRFLEVGQTIAANKFETYLVRCIVNLNQARLMKAIQEGASKTSKPLPENTSNPAFRRYYEMAKDVLQARDDKKGRLFWR